MKLTRTLLPLFAAVALPLGLFAQEAPAKRPDSPAKVLTKSLQAWAAIVEPAEDAAPRTFSARLRVTRAEGLSGDWLGKTAGIAYQAPGRLRVEVEFQGLDFVVGRDDQEVWIHAPEKGFAVRGLAGLPRFSATPEAIDETELAPFSLGAIRAQLALLPLFLKVEDGEPEEVGGVACRVVSARPQPKAIETFGIPDGRLDVWIRSTDGLPARLAFADGEGLEVAVDVDEPSLAEPWGDERWALAAGEGATVETAALSHILRFFDVVVAHLGNEIPTLGPATGERRLIATSGKGRLEEHDGTKVMFLEGTPEEMGRQHGELMAGEVRNLMDRILYGVGIGSSFDKGRWFFGEIEEAQSRLLPFMDERYLRELDALADASGLERQEVRLGNFFPELFHCSGFAVFGKATEGGRMYHGRILDYLKGVGLEQSAVVTVVKPDEGNAWVNVGYAGFVGTVTAMNEKHVAIGEMGGRGEGQWDGKPMAQLMREVMEEADTLEEGLEIMRRGPRTCEYYYVLSDAKTMRAVGIAATPDSFIEVWPGESHERLPHGIEDTVLLSAGDRYERLVERVRAGYGKIDDEAARRLMDRPVAMSSNIHSVLFAPDTLELWVANADSENVASHTRYTRYDLKELLRDPEGEVAAGQE